MSGFGEDAEEYYWHTVWAIQGIKMILISACDPPPANLKMTEAARYIRNLVAHEVLSMKKANVQLYRTKYPRTLQMKIDDLEDGKKHIPPPAIDGDANWWNEYDWNMAREGDKLLDACNMTPI